MFRRFTPFRARASWAVLAGLLASPLALISAPTAGAVAILPPGFQDALVASVPSPTEVAFTPDGRTLIATQPGQLRVIENGALRPAPVITLPVCSNGERGLLGLAVDPDFETNNFIYVYYTQRNDAACPASGAGAPVNRVVRYELEDDNEAVDPVVLIDNIPSFGNHNGGDVNFGPDGECGGDACLYVSVGDGGCDLVAPAACQNENDNAQDDDTLLGKMLRIDPDDGAAGSGNPFVGDLGAEACGDADGVDDADVCNEVWAKGLRNPFQFTFTPDQGALRINDVGTATFEEVNDVASGDPGAAPHNFGFNFREGPCPLEDLTEPCPAPPLPPGFEDPIFSYRHGALADCEAITGAAFVPEDLWPSPWDESYLFSDFTCGKIFRINETGAGPFDAGDAEVFADNLGVGAGISMTFGPAGLTTGLYYTSHANGGEVRRVTFGAVPAVRAIVSTEDGDGLWLADSQGRVYDFGTAPDHGDVAPSPGTTIVGMAATDDDDGYWLAATNGRVFARDTDHFGDTSGVTLNLPVVGMAKTPDDGGYWLVAADGGVFTFGNAEFFGSLAKIKLNRPIVGIAATPDGEGYFLVAADGGVFTFGNAEFKGALGKVKLNKPVVGMAATNDGEGYWLVASDGGVFTFGNANFKGATGSMPPSTPAIGMAVTPSDDGYWIAATDGTVIDFQDAVFPF